MPPSIFRATKLSLLIFALLQATDASARVLDDFRQGLAFMIGGDMQLKSFQQSGLDPSHAVGGTRDITIYNIVVVNILPMYQYAAAPQPIPTGRSGFPNGYFTLEYGESTPLNVDLTADGSNFVQATFEGGTGERGFPAILANTTLTIASLDGSGALLTKTVPFNGSYTVYDSVAIARIPFSQFSSLNNVQKIVFQSSAIPRTEQYRHGFTLSQFVTVVPEPATLALIASSLFNSVAQLLPQHFALRFCGLLSLAAL
jgi:hypothetical protein